MSSRHWSKCQNQRDQRCSGGNGIGEQRYCHVSAAQPFRQDAGTDHCREQKRGPEKFRANSLRQRKIHCRPIRSTAFCIARPSRLATGKLKRRLILRSRVTKASRNARSICSGVPSTAAGSGTPQWAVTGCPGHTGQISFAALSQTVNTKSIFGAPGFANSSQLLLRKPETGSLAVSSCFIS